VLRTCRRDAGRVKIFSDLWPNWASCLELVSHFQHHVKCNAAYCDILPIGDHLLPPHQASSGAVYSIEKLILARADGPRSRTPPFQMQAGSRIILGEKDRVVPICMAWIEYRPLAYRIPSTSVQLCPVASPLTAQRLLSRASVLQLPALSRLPACAAV
jgi:hypothetical protein